MTARRGRAVSAIAAAFLASVSCSACAAGAQSVATTTTGTSRPSTGTGPILASTPAAALNQFGLDLLGRAGASNAVVSPYSVELALAMVDAGAGGRTEKQIGDVLHLSGGSARVLAAVRRLQRAVAAAVRGAGAPTLDVANGMWLQSMLSLEGPFAATLSQTFGAAPQRADFAGDPETARRAINAWVAMHTAQIIQNLMPAGSVTARTALVLANALYLKAAWSSPFATGQTTPGSFTLAGGRKVKVPFMHEPRLQGAELARGKGYVAVELPYASSRLGMLTVMPVGSTARQFEAAMSAASLQAISAALRPTFMALSMPRFHLASHFDLSGTLSALGMPDAFTHRADLSGISKTPLQIQAVEHGADLKVDEAGTIAAAATGISVEPTAVAVGPSVRVSLDHPFVTFVEDLDNGAILFQARVDDPSIGQF